MLRCYPPCPARRDPGDLLIAIGTVWRFLMCVWRVLSRVSAPAAMPSERAVRHRARQAAEARPRMRVSEQDCQSNSLQPPNIFPERERRDTRALQHTCLHILLTYTHLLKEEALKIQKSRRKYNQYVFVCPQGFNLKSKQFKRNSNRKEYFHKISYFTITPSSPKSWQWLKHPTKTLADIS